jgi:hypothetical protein
MLLKRGAEESRVVRQLVEWAKEQKLDLTFGRAQQSASFIPIVRTPGGQRYPIAVSTTYGFVIQMRWLRDHAPFRDAGKREELRAKLNAIPGVSIPADRMTGFPTLPLQALTSDAALRACLEVLTGIVQELRAAPSTTSPEQATPT